ncbi:MAG: hypothetical protein ACI841_005030, partial [Planctomycetota bacterium]
RPIIAEVGEERISRALSVRLAADGIVSCRLTSGALDVDAFGGAASRGLRVSVRIEAWILIAASGYGLGGRNHGRRRA